MVDGKTIGLGLNVHGDIDFPKLEAQVKKIEKFSKAVKLATENVGDLEKSVSDYYDTASGFDGRKSVKAKTVSSQAVDVSNILANINQAGAKLASALSSSATKVYGSLQSWASMDQWKVKKGVNAFQDTVSGFSDKMNANVNKVTPETLKYYSNLGSGVNTLGRAATAFQDVDINKSLSSFDKFIKESSKSLEDLDKISSDLLSKLKSFGHGINTLDRVATAFQDVDINKSLSSFDKFIKESSKSLEDLDKISPDLLRKLKSFGYGINESSNGLKKYIKMTDAEYELAKKRALDMQTSSTWNAYNNNKAVHQQAIADNNMWFTNMFDKSKPFMQRMKSSAKMLGGDLKNTMIGGLKGLITGGIFNLALKGAKKAIDIMLTPIKSIYKIGTSFARLLIKTATGTEVFKKLIELTLLPFTLLFTLMFAPILVKLAPLLVNIVQSVVDKWDVLQRVGDKIAEILSLFFDDNNWFSLGNVVDTVIQMLDDLSDVAYNTFKMCQEAGMTGLDAVVSIATAVIIEFVNKIISFMYSADGMYLFFAVGEIVGLLIVEALKLAIAALAPTIVSVFGILGGILGTTIAEIVSGLANSLRSVWFIGGWLSDALSNMSTDISNTTDSGRLESNIYDKLSSQGIYNKGDSTINSINTISYMTINNNSYQPLGGMYTTKQYATRGM